jgi:hypothetical protein
MSVFKLQVQDDDAHPEKWRDVLDETGAAMIFTKEEEARKRLEELFPVLFKLEKFAAGPKRTRVVVVNAYADIDDEKEE